VTKTLLFGSIVFALSASGVVRTPAQSPLPLPDVPIQTYSPAMQQAIAPAYREARVHPGDAARVGALGRVLHAWEQWESAHDMYSRASTLEPLSFEWRYLDACVLDRLARPAGAVITLREALKTRPDYLPARVRLAETLLSAGQIEESRSLFTALVREPEAEPQALFGLGRIAASEDRHEEAVRDIQRALTLFPEWGAANYSLALSLRALGRREEAQEALQRHEQYGARWPSVADPVLSAVIRMRTDSAARLRRAQKLVDGGDVSGAIAEYEGALAADPSLSIAHRSLITLYGNARNWEKAEEHYRAGLALGADLAELHYDYGVLLGLQQKWPEAEDAYRRTIAINPGYPEAHNNLGQVLERSRQFDAALAEYQRALEGQPTFRLARFNLGRMLIATGRAAEAIVELQKITEPRDSEAPKYLFALSTAYVQAGQKSEGIRWAGAARRLALQYGDSALAAAIDRNLAAIR
jgi:tetratricopeptide (TPR) repeat protein